MRQFVSFVKTTIPQCVSASVTKNIQRSHIECRQNAVSNPCLAGKHSHTLQAVVTCAQLCCVLDLDKFCLDPGDFSPDPDLAPAQDFNFKKFNFKKFISCKYKIFPSFSDFLFRICLVKIQIIMFYLQFLFLIQNFWLYLKNVNFFKNKQFNLFYFLYYYIFWLDLDPNPDQADLIRSRSATLLLAAYYSMHILVQ